MHRDSICLTKPKCVNDEKLRQLQKEFLRGQRPGIMTSRSLGEIPTLMISNSTITLPKPHEILNIYIKKRIEESKESSPSNISSCSKL